MIDGCELGGENDGLSGHNNQPIVLIAKGVLN